MPNTKPKRAGRVSEGRVVTPTSLYLDDEARRLLEGLASSTGQSMSHVMRNLIHGAAGTRQQRLTELIAEAADLLELREVVSDKK